MARVSPEQYAEKWARRLKGSAEDIRNGVENVTTAPGQAAAAAQERMLQNLIESIQSGRWADAVKSVSLEEWKDSVLRKGLQRLAAGVDAAEQKQAEMARRLLAAVDAAAAKVHAMPKGTIEDSVNRSATFIREMHKAKGKIRA